MLGHVMIGVMDELTKRQPKEQAWRIQQGKRVLLIYLFQFLPFGCLYSFTILINTYLGAFIHIFGYLSLSSFLLLFSIQLSHQTPVRLIACQSPLFSRVVVFEAQE